jgi:hypothetical protein
MNFFTGNYSEVFPPLAYGISCAPLFLGKNKPSVYVRTCLIKSLERVLNSNIMARQKKQRPIKAHAELEHMLHTKYPQDFWDAQNTYVLAVCLLKKEDWILPLYELVFAKN